MRKPPVRIPRHMQRNKLAIRSETIVLLTVIQLDKIVSGVDISGSCIQNGCQSEG